MDYLERNSRYLEGGRPLGITEGFHTKMEMRSRRAYRFKNFNNYRLNDLAHCGWNGIINRV